ncbi:MAG TPA: hypothetical protein VNY07_11575 [Chthoniobacterales bacterium]|jgi:hypothetical protein|nr:hypothetical protein [Chthoniobacterales bacterium]
MKSTRPGPSEVLFGASTNTKIDCVKVYVAEGWHGVITLWFGFCCFFRACLRRLFARATILCALGLLPGSVIATARLPPLWRDTDGLFQVASPPGQVTLLHFPALYPFLSRLPILLVSAWRSAGHLHSLQLSVGRWVALNDAGLLLLIAGQQLALIFALALLTVTCTKHPILRCLIVVVFLCNPVLFIGAQLISSEALASILLILLIAIAVELSRRQELSPNGIIALGVCLYANAMTRHLNAIGAALLPMASLLGVIAHIRKGSEGRIYFKRFVVTCAVGLVAIVAANLTTRGLCVIFREPYRSTVARTAISRLDLIDQMSAADRANYLRGLQAKASDPITKEAIPAILAAKEYWGGSMRVIEHLIQRQQGELKGTELHAMADHYLEEICVLYYRSLPPIALADIGDAIIRSLTSTTPTQVIQYLYTNADYSLKIYRSNPALHQRTAHLKSCSPIAAAAIKRAETTLWLRGLDKVPCGITLVLLLALATILRSLERFDRNVLCLLYALAITNLLLMIGTFVVALYLPRYVLPSCVINAAALAILLGNITRPAHMPKKAA